MTEAEKQWITLAFIVIVSAGVLIVDVFFIRWSGPSASISNVMSTFFAKHPIWFAMFIFWVGLLCGHLFPTN